MKTAVIQFDEYATPPNGARQRHRAIDANSQRGWVYLRAAELDERNGFPFTAAMEWRKAAECFGSLPLISERCWQEWERIVQLPRESANLKIGSEQGASVGYSSTR